jgi:hypothetical protein
MIDRATRAGMLRGAAALALLAGGAQAQDFCGGASANGQWIGGTEAASDAATATAPLEQMALVLQQNEYVALFSLSQPVEVRLEAQGRGSGDPVIELRNEAGDVVGSDDDSGGNSAARLEQGLEPGRYCLLVRSYDGSPLTGFVRVGRTDQEPLTAGLNAEPPPPAPDPAQPVDPAQAPEPYLNGVCDVSTLTRFIGTGASVDADLAAGGASATASATEVPTWGFRLGQPAALSITAENPDADPLITLYDEYGSYLAENDDYDGLNARIDVNYELAAGTYCVAMQALSDPSQPITVTVAAYDAQAAQVGMYQRGEASPPLDGSYPVTALGTLGGRLRQDIQSTDQATWFSLDVAEPGLVLVEAVTNGMGDPSLVMFDDFGRQVARNDDNGETLDALLTARVQPGTYVVGVFQLGMGTEVLTRMLFERYVPAE